MQIWGDLLFLMVMATTYVVLWSYNFGLTLCSGKDFSIGISKQMRRFLSWSCVGLQMHTQPPCIAYARLFSEACMHCPGSAEFLMNLWASGRGVVWATQHHVCRLTAQSFAIYVLLSWLPNFSDFGFLISKMELRDICLLAMCDKWNYIYKALERCSKYVSSCLSEMGTC